MGNTLDFVKLKRLYFNVTLPDENETKIQIFTPTKELMDEFIDFQKVEKTDAETKEELYELCAKLMSQNKMGTPITAEHLKECLDEGDLIIFIRSYSTFLRELGNSKNS